MPPHLLRELQSQPDWKSLLLKSKQLDEDFIKTGNFKMLTGVKI
ncbi:MAG: hypothetical protein RR557_08350 [Bacilli bacterium]